MNLLKRFWPVIFILIVWFAFSSPYFVKHKVPFSSTYLVNFFSPWNAYPGFSSPIKNNAMPDVITQIYPWKNFTINSFKNFQIPLWNPYSFSGTPHVANYQSAVLSPFNLLFFILPFIDAWSILILLQPLLAGIFMYIFLRALKLGQNSSLLGSLAFMFCGFITTWMAYGTLGYAIIFLPFALYLAERFYNTKKTRFLVIYSFTFPLSFFSGHFQISIYFFLFVLAYIIFKFYENRNLRNTFYLILYTIFGIFLSLPQLLPSMELYTQSLRSGIFEKLEVIPWGYLPTFISPDYLGNPVTRNDWFGHYAEWNAYIGVLPVLLGFYALSKKSKEILFFGLMALLAILFSFQTPFLDLLVALKVPVLSTSAASRVIVLFSFSMAVLSAFGLEKLLIDINGKKSKNVLIFIGLSAVAFIILWAVILLKIFMPLDKVLIARQNLILPTGIFLVFSVLILLPLFLKLKKRSNIVLCTSYLILILVAFDLLRFSTKWMPFDPTDLMYPQVPIVSELNKISGYERVLSNMGGEATTFYRLPSIEGYDAVYIKRYGEFIASLGNGDLTESARSVVSFPKNGLYSKKAVNLLGVKYIIHKTADDHAVWTFPFWTSEKGTFSIIYDDGVYQILENNRAYPRAFLADRYEVESNPQKILNTMFSSNIDLKNYVVLEENPKLKLTETQGSAKITLYTPNRVVINTSSNGSSMLFLSDTYYPGWKATIDGRETKIYRADYTFRAIYVPGGNHKIEFIYNPLSFRLGILGFVFGIILAFGVGFYIQKKKLF